MRVHEDERRSAYCDLFHGLPGDVNVFVGHEGATTAWHKHERQCDQFFVAKGAARFRWFNDVAHRECTLRAGQEPITIPAGWWHGYQVLEEGTITVMYLDQKYNPDDEFRATEAELGVPF